MKSVLKQNAFYLLPAAILFVLMAITFLDVVGRDFFASPLPGTYDIVSYLLALMVFASAPGIAARRGHIIVDVLDRFTPAPIARLRNIAIELFLAAMMALFSWRLVLYAIDAYTYDQVSTDIYLPMWPVAAFCALMSAITAIVHCHNVIVTVRSGAQS